MQRRKASAFSRLIEGAALGAVAMYMLDPDRGRRRRAITRDKVHRFASDTARLANQAARDARQQLHGVNARLQQRSQSGNDGSVDELRLIERVRAALGRCVSHPHAIQVGAHGTTVVLSGPILRSEVVDLLASARAVPGVADVEHHLDAHDSADRIPSLQGEGRRHDTPPQNWNPTLRLAALIGGGVLALYGLGKRNASGLVLASAGVGLAARVVGNEPLERWIAGTAQQLISGDSGTSREDAAITPSAQRPVAPAEQEQSPAPAAQDATRYVH